MEYKNIDDSPAAGADAAEAAEKKAVTAQAAKEEAIPADEEVQGLFFAKLVERKPAVAAELRELRVQLQKEEAESSSSASTNMKVWRMRDFGLQAAQTIAKAKDPLRKLQDLAQNFPSHASWLSSVKVSNDVRSGAMAALQEQVLGYGTQLKPGSVFINGLQRSLSGPTFNVFDVIKAIRDEIKLLQRLEQFKGTSSSSITKELLRIGVGKTPAAGDGGTARLDIYRGSKGAIFYLNNIEKDPQYQRWPRSLRQLLMPSWQLIAVARNLYTMTLIVDLTEPAAVKALLTLRDLYERVFPIRFSILLVSRPLIEKAKLNPALLADESGYDSAFFDGVKGAKDRDPVTTEALGLLFHHLREEYDIQTALIFLFGIAEKKVPCSYARVRHVCVCVLCLVFLLIPLIFSRS